MLELIYATNTIFRKWRGFFINVYILLACMTSSFDIRVVYILSEDDTFKMKSPQFLKDQFLSKKRQYLNNLNSENEDF